MRRIYLDLDGVIFDFEGSFEKFFGIKHNSMPDSEMWKLINEHGEFFQNIEPFENAKEFFDTLSELHEIYDVGEVIILTACPKSNYWNAAKQKKQSVRTHIDPDVMVLPVLGGKNKALFMHEPGDILIDDFEKNIQSWVSEGGIGILHTDFDSTIFELGQLWD